MYQFGCARNLVRKILMGKDFHCDDEFLNPENNRLISLIYELHVFTQKVFFFLPFDTQQNVAS